MFHPRTVKGPDGFERGPFCETSVSIHAPVKVRLGKAKSIARVLFQSTDRKVHLYQGARCNSLIVQSTHLRVDFRKMASV
jgi:hypothetical protein